MIIILMKPRHHSIIASIFLILFFYLLGCFAYALICLPNIISLKVKDPYTGNNFVRYADISPYLINAVITAEDTSFFKHKGIEPRSIYYAFRYNIRKKRIARSGSTITQQLAKTLFLSQSRTFTRKIIEIMISFEIELALDKKRILEIYLNTVDWGNGITGCEDAAQKYFKVSSKDITADQAIRLASILINPHRWNPYSEKLDYRRRILAWRMLSLGYITQEEFDNLPYKEAEIPALKKMFGGNIPK